MVGRLCKKQADPRELPTPAMPREDGRFMEFSSGETPGRMEGEDRSEN